MSEKLNYAAKPKASKGAMDAYTRGPIGPAMLRMGMHMAMGHLAMSIFNITDTYFVSKLGTVPLAAMSFTFPIVFLAFTLMFGIGIGTAAVVSRAVGSGDEHRLKRLTTDSLLLTFVVGCIVTALGLIFLDPLLKAMGAEGETLKLAGAYLRLWFWAFPLAALPMVGNNAIRASGDTRTPAAIMSISALLNLALDPLFIFGMGPFPAMGILGAATATILSRYISTAAALWIIIKRLKLITLEWPGLRGIAESWKSLLHTAAPASTTFTFLPLSMYILTGMMARFGNPAVAAMGAASRFEGLTLIPVMALSSVLLPFVGQNYGRGHFDRILHSLKLSRYFAMTWGVLVIVLMVTFAGPISRLFSSDAQVLSVLKWALIILPLSHGGVGLGMTAGSGLNAIGSPLHAACVTALRSLALSIPLAWLGSHIWGPLGIFWGIAAARILAGIASERWLHFTVVAKRNKVPEANAMSEPPEEPEELKACAESVRD